MTHIYSLKYLTLKIYELPKLSREAIKKKHISARLFLFGFYEYYDELDNYTVNQLNKIKINIYGRNILIMAAYYNKIRLIKYLLGRGVDINISTNYNWNAYMYACSNNNIKIKVLKLLENNGANIQKIEVNGYNIFLLVLCAVKQQIKVLEHLKSKGIDIHKVNQFNKNACFYADSLKLIKYLESAGINIHYKYKDYKVYTENLYSNIIKYSDQRDKNTFRLLKYLKSRGVRTYYSNNYKYCDYCGYNKILKHLLISNSNNRYKNITCYI